MRKISKYLDREGRKVINKSIHNPLKILNCLEEKAKYRHESSKWKNGGQGSQRCRGRTFLLGDVTRDCHNCPVYRIGISFGRRRDQSRLQILAPIKHIGSYEIRSH